MIIEFESDIEDDIDINLDIEFEDSEIDNDSDIEFEIELESYTENTRFAETHETLIIEDVKTIFNVIRKSIIEINKNKKSKEKINYYFNRYLTDINIECIAYKLNTQLKFQYNYIKNKPLNFDKYLCFCYWNDIIREINYTTLFTEFDLLLGEKEKVFNKIINSI